MDSTTSSAKAHYQLARQVMPGGVNSSVRLNQALGMPLYVARTQGARVIDIEDREYIDMCCGHGAALLGHAHPAIDDALRIAAEAGYASAFETPYHEQLARIVCADIPCAERVRFCNSGTEATLHLIRACRAYTGRAKIIRIEGHLHGYHEMTYIGGQPPREYWPRNRESPYPESAGIPEEFSRLVVPIPHNCPDSLAAAIDRHGHDTALVILEPINWNWGGIETEASYLKLVRELTRQAGIVLFFDETQSAYKTRHFSLQAEAGVSPDVCAIGKALGGGTPLSAFCGRAEIMDLFRPVGDVAHSGTFNAHLIPVLAGLAFLREAHKPYFYGKLEALATHFHGRINAIIKRYDLNMVVPYHGARFNIVFGRRTPARRYEDCFCHETRVMHRFVKECFARGVYFHDYGGSPAHHGFSVQHSSEDLDVVAEVMEEVLRLMKAESLL